MQQTNIKGGNDDARRDYHAPQTKFTTKGQIYQEHISLLADNTEYRAQSITSTKTGT